MPLPGILKAGSYGLEMETAAGDTLHQVEYHTIRPLLERLKKQWQPLLAGRGGFYLEDKEWTLAIHAKDAAAEEATAVLREARRQAQTLLDEEEEDLFRWLGGHRFLECGPNQPTKGERSTSPGHDSQAR